MLNSEFAAIAGPTPDYCPEHLRGAIDETNAFVLRGVNNAVNGCGYSISQEAYDEQAALLFATLDALEERLGRQRYLCGDVQTEAVSRIAEAITPVPGGTGPTTVAVLAQQTLSAAERRREQR